MGRGEKGEGRRWPLGFAKIKKLELRVKGVSKLLSMMGFLHRAKIGCIAFYFIVKSSPKKSFL
jgi:hypothetical protein